MYRPIYQVTHDIDCFFVMNGWPIHFASNGGVLPGKLGTISDLQDMQIAAQELPMQYDFELNWVYLDTLNSEDFPTEEEMAETGFLNTEHFTQFNNIENIPFHVKLYVHSFVEMAKRGFWSFDRLTDTLENESYGNGVASVYQLIAWPNSDKDSISIKLGHKFSLKNYNPFYLGSDQLDLYSMICNAKKDQ